METQYRVRRSLTSRRKENSGFEYNAAIDYEKDKVVELGKMIHKCTHCTALKWKDESTGICCSRGVKRGLVRQLQHMVHEVNPYIEDLKSTIDSIPQDCENFQVVIRAEEKPAVSHSGRFSEPSCREIALAIAVQQFEKRGIIL
ncbi:hypothetical protein EVAR_69265_1 [Eumeta japonica]|uniref:Uncharacterized protein n=1 Tax=Eumeta variegata TaxID=151549 RepID=A0A4C1TDM9_EUMVA|nr:hypothetical protein EVAR_69265_1 [Eumeta japonica]